MSTLDQWHDAVRNHPITKSLAGDKPMSIVEEVAKAIALAGNGGTWEDWYNEDQKELHRRRARAAIKAFLSALNELEGLDQ